MERGKSELQSRKYYRVIAPDTTYTGEICVAIMFTKTLLKQAKLDIGIASTNLSISKARQLLHREKEMEISGTLEVVLVSAEGIKTRDTIGCLGFLVPWINATNPYVFVQHGSQEHISSVAEDGGKKHVWNEKFKFNVEYQGGEKHPQHKLIFRVMDKHKISEDEFAGEAT
ncbi:hypothetical protein RJ639_007045 [Escallonia herrerae]|uniref:C2 domain-containing protein n=1 Tax=Escallonia herrerae TaxID=1293975 RepID=A0AA88VYL5_9ASTE|nr:hypothetical protein RJ639_007045 [Escallonia herrerae]